MADYHDLRTVEVKVLVKDRCLPSSLHPLGGGVGQEIMQCHAHDAHQVAVLTFPLWIFTDPAGVLPVSRNITATFGDLNRITGGVSP